jgi:hypothetical protein
MSERENDYIIVLWETKDNRKHHRTFLATEIKEAEKHCKELWQKSALTEAEAEEKGQEDWKRDKANMLKNMSIFRGRHLSWDKEEVPVVKSFKLKEETEGIM